MPRGPSYTVAKRQTRPSLTREVAGSPRLRALAARRPPPGAGLPRLDRQADRYAPDSITASTGFGSRTNILSSTICCGGIGNSRRTVLASSSGERSVSIGATDPGLGLLALAQLRGPVLLGGEPLHLVEAQAKVLRHIAQRCALARVRVAAGYLLRRVSDHAAEQAVGRALPPATAMKCGAVAVVARESEPQ